MENEAVFDIKLNLDKDFVKELKQLKKKYGEKFEKLNGFHNSNLNFTDFIDNFIDTSTVADTTIDPNANSSTHDLTTMMADMVKPHQKLLSFNKIFYEIKKQYNLKTAKEWFEKEYSGEFYLHDAATSSFKPYCYAYDLQSLVDRGLWFVDKFNAQPAKHLDTFNSHVLEFVSYMANKSSGACGLPSYLVHSFYYWKHDCEEGRYLKDPDYYRRQMFQKFIYELNQPYLRVTECAFTNISIMDRNYLIELFGGRTYPDGTYIIDYIDDIIEYQKVFMEVVSQVRHEMMVTFPVLTMCLLYQNGKFVDEEFARWCNKHNCQWLDSNFFVSGDVTNLSSCCFDGDTMTLSKSSNGVNYMTFKELYNSAYNETKRNFTIFHNGSWVKGRVIQLPKQPMYKITTSNKKEIIVTNNHLHATLKGDKPTTELTCNDYLMFNNMTLDTFAEKDMKLTYEQGFLIGMYLGDGSKRKHKDCNSATVHFSLNKNKYINSIEILEKALKDWNIEANLILGKEVNHTYPVNVHSIELFEIIENWVEGNYANTKELNMDCLLQSRQFRQGILDGYYLTDGGNSNRIYTTSAKLVYQMETLITSLGLNSIIDVSDRTNEAVIIRGESWNRNYPLYCIRWYAQSNKRTTNNNAYKIINNSIYFKITSIEPVEIEDDYVYCFEMANQDEPYFTLPNGLITHNCRMLNDTSKLSGFINSIGGTALSVGSVKVSTINLRRLALRSNGDKELYIKLLKEDVELDMKVLAVVRSIIRRNVEKGLLPNYQDGLIEFDKQFCSIGITASAECLEEFNLIDEDEMGNKSYSDEGMKFICRILDTINELKDNSGYNFTFNVECIPAENANVKLSYKDQLLFPDAKCYPVYSNQWIPLVDKCTLKEKIRLGNILDKQCGGGLINNLATC